MAGFNTNAVAARAGVSVGSLYQYFPGKDALVAALIGAERESLLADVRTAIAESAGRSLEAGLRRLLAVSVAHQTERPALARALDGEEHRLHHLIDLPASLAAVQNELAGFLESHDVAEAWRAAGDLMTMTRALVDAAAERDEADWAGVAGRLLAAAGGYLGRPLRRRPARHAAAR